MEHSSPRWKWKTFWNKKTKADIFLLSAPWVEVLSLRCVLRRLSGREWLVTARSLLSQRETTEIEKLCSTETTGRKWKSHSDADKSDSPLMYFGNSAAFGKAWKGCVEKGNALSEQYFNWQWPENRSAVFHHTSSPCFSYTIFSPIPPPTQSMKASSHFIWMTASGS